MRRTRRGSPEQEGPEQEGRGERLSAPATPPDPAAERERLLAYAFRALGQRSLSEAELRTRLLRRTEDGALAEAILARLKELGYLNDAEVARQESARRGVGGYRVGQKLRQRGLERALVDETVAARDPDAEYEDALALLRRRWDSFARAADPRSRAYGFLARRGYPSGVIWRALRELGQNQEDGAEDGDE